MFYHLLSREKHGVNNLMDILKQCMLGWGSYSKSLRFTGWGQEGHLYLRAEYKPW